MTSGSGALSPAPRPAWGGVAIAVVTIALMVGIAMNSPRSPAADAGSLGLCIGAAIAIVWTWTKSSGRTFLVALATLAIFAARLHTPSSGTASLRPLSPALHEPPTLEARADGMWLVHPLGFEMRVPPGTELYEDEATLRAGRYSTLAADMVTTSWVDEGAQWDVDVVAARISGVREADRARSFEDLVRAALAAMATAGAHYERSQREGPRDEWVWLTVEGAPMATRFVTLDVPDGELFVTINVRADVDAGIAHVQTLRLR